MKNLFLGLVAIMVFGFEANAQSQDRRIKTCITLSCCGIGPFGIEIWSETTCSYVYTAKSTNGSHSLKFETNQPVKEVEVKEDVILAGHYDENGNCLALKMGKYVVNNNEIQFTPISVQARKYCYKRVVTGSFMGNDYNYSFTICVEFLMSFSSRGALVISTNLTKDELNRLKEHDGMIEIYNDIKLNENGIDYTLKAGKYYVNDDGNIYLQNVGLK